MYVAYHVGLRYVCTYMYQQQIKKKPEIKILKITIPVYKTQYIDNINVKQATKIISSWA